MKIDIEKLLPILYEKAINLGTKLLGVIVLWIVGRYVISWIKKLVGKSLRLRSTEATVISYAESVISVLLNILLVASLLGLLGVETTSLAGLLAAAGLAIGTAWGGLLANFAAGAFMTILRPFKKGDFVTIAGGVTGTVEEIGIFVTTIHTMDNVLVMVGNNKVFSDTIQNFTVNPYRRVDRTAQLAHDADHAQAIRILKEALAKIPNVLQSPAPDVEIVDFTLAGPVLAVRPYCHNDHYWQVYFDTNRAIREELGKAGFSVPEQHLHLAPSARALPAALPARRPGVDAPAPGASRASRTSLRGTRPSRCASATRSLQGRHLAQRKPNPSLEFSGLLWLRAAARSPSGPLTCQPPRCPRKEVGKSAKLAQSEQDWVYQAAS